MTSTAPRPTPNVPARADAEPTPHAATDASTHAHPDALAPFLAPRPIRWHRPLLITAVAMGVLAVISAVMAVVAPIEILGQNAWFKPLKFAVSIAIYAVTLSWLIGQLQRMRRLANIAGSIAVVGLFIEIVIIVGAVATGTTSHFNVSTPFATAMWSAMAGSIVMVWVVTLVIGVALFRNPEADPARTLGIRAAVVLALIGMALAFLMTGPNSAQLNDFQGVAGAHAVGVPDGGAGLPVLGWSTEGGDLRIPHFVGMHALQVIPLALLGVEALSRRAAVLRSARVRLQLVVVVTVVFTAVLAILLVQALIGQSIVRPDVGVLLAGALVALGGVVATVAVLARGRRVLAREGKHAMTPA